MTAPPLDLYDRALSSHSTSASNSREGWSVRYSDGRVLPLALGRWCGTADIIDREILGRCADPILDVGCGPGRLVAALAASGRCALGVDIAASAVRLAQISGACAVRRSVFDPLPGEGRWATVLLIDGNIGIGGDPGALLRRCRQLMTDNGTIVVELDPPGQDSESVRVRIESFERQSRWFPWAHVASDRIQAPAQNAGLRVVDSWVMAGRWFACLAR